MKQYKAKSGKFLYKPSYEELLVCDRNNEAFCLACGEMSQGYEPDTNREECPVCHEHKLFGNEELLAMGLFYSEAIAK